MVSQPSMAGRTTHIPCLRSPANDCRVTHGGRCARSTWPDDSFEPTIEILPNFEPCTGIRINLVAAGTAVTRGTPRPDPHGRSLAHTALVADTGRRKRYAARRTPLSLGDTRCRCLRFTAGLATHSTKLEAEWLATPFRVRVFHPLLPAGSSRRTTPFAFIDIVG